MFSFSSFCASLLSLMMSFCSYLSLLASQRTCSGLKGSISISCYLLEHNAFQDGKGRATCVRFCVPQVLLNSDLCCIRQRRVGVHHRQDSRLPMPHTLHVPQKASWHSLKAIRAIYTVTEYCPGSKRYSSIRWSQKQITLHCTEQSRKSISISPQIYPEGRTAFWTQSEAQC